VGARTHKLGDEKDSLQPSLTMKGGLPKPNYGWMGIGELACYHLTGYHSWFSRSGVQQDHVIGFGFYIGDSYGNVFKCILIHEDGSLHSGPGEYLLLLIFYWCNSNPDYVVNITRHFLCLFMVSCHCLCPLGVLKVGLLTSYCWDEGTTYNQLYGVAHTPVVETLAISYLVQMYYSAMHTHIFYLLL